MLFGLSDVLFTILAFEFAYQSRVWLPFERVFYLSPPVHALLLGFSALAWLVIGRSLDVYTRLDAGNPRTIFRDSLRQSLVGLAAVVVLEYLLRLDVSRGFLALFGAYSVLLLCLFRLSSGRLVGLIRRGFGVPHHVMVVGTGPSARRLGEALEQSAQYGVRLMGFLSETSESAPERIGLQADYEVLALSELPLLLRKQVVDEVLFATERRSLAGLEDLLVLCDEQGVRTRIVLDFFPHVNSDMYLDRLGGLPLLTFAAAPHDEVRLFAKRVTDFVLAGAALVVLAPAMIAVAALIRLTSPGGAIFRQVRCGFNGRTFTLYKFRSMYRDAEERRAELEHLNRKSTAFKIPDDPRRTPVGRWLRRFSIDELPQLWNVLKGDMSLVGPRPAVPCEVEQYQGWQRRRLRMRPGLTCLWALEGRDHLDFDTWMKRDMEYIDNWTLALDWKILLRTVPKVLSGKGAY